MKICSKCGEADINKFHEKNDNSYCKLCQSEYARQHYKRNKDRYAEVARKNKSRQKTEKQSFVYGIKESNACADCNRFHPYYVMQFDHLFDKENNVSALVSSNYSLNAILSEIQKCDLVCTNCHKHRTYTRNRGLATTRSSVLFLREFKHNKQCMDCKNTYPWWILELDHVRGEKIREVSVLAWYSGLDAVRNEIEKCDLVCGNCHAKRTHGSVAEYGDCTSLEN